MAPKSNPSKRGRGRATAAEKGKRKAPISDSSDSSTPSPPPKRQARQRGPGINIQEGNIAQESVSVFRNDKDKVKFDKEFVDRRLTRDKSIDFQFFTLEDFEFPAWLRNFGLERFLTQKEDLFEKLVRMFYFYLEVDESTHTYTSFVNGVEMKFNLREFSEIMQLPFDLEYEAEDISMHEKIELLTGRENMPEASFFAKELKSIDLRILFNIVCNCLYPRAGGFDKVTADDIELLYGIVTGNRMSLTHTMLQYMVQQRNRSNGYLPFGMSLSRLFKHFQVDLTNEKASKFTSYNLVNDSTLKRMRITKVDGAWKDKGRAEVAEEAVQAQEAGREEDPTAQPQQAEAAPTQGENLDFDSFSIEDLTRDHSPSNLTPPQTIPQTIPSTSTPLPSVDLSPIMTFLQEQFFMLNSKVSQMETKLENLRTDFTSFQTETTKTLTETSDKVDMVEMSFACNCPQMFENIKTIKDNQNSHHESLTKTIHSATVALQDLRDNSDRICLQYEIPTLNEILRDLNAQVRREYRESRKERPPPPPPQPNPDTNPPPKPDSKPSGSKSKPRAPRKSAKRSKPQSSSSSGSYDPDNDPYVDNVKDESE